jgi:hypothetical protein
MRRWWVWLVGAVAVLAVALVVGSFFIDEPLRRYLERRVNTQLQGYSVHIGALDVHPFSLSVDIKDLLITQDAHPEPPIIRVPDLTAGVQGRALLSRQVVADIQVQRPTVYLNLTQVRQEARDQVPLRERGWQEAVEAALPLRINELQVVNGEVTYVDADPGRPLRLSQLNVHAGNIRNVKSDPGTYPSDVQVDAVLNGVGHIALKGQADFLAAPHAAVNADLMLGGVELSQFQPVASRHNVSLRRGVLSASGTIEYAPNTKIIHLRQATIEGLQMDYVHTAKTAVVEQKRVQQAKRVAEEVSNAPGILVRADQLDIVGGTFGFVNRAARPEYRVFLDRAEVHLHNFSNQLTEGTAVAKVTGRFMGSGRTVVGANFRPETRGPDFALAASIEDTDMRALNQLLRAYGKFDVAEGFFSVYTEMRVRNRAVQGYVKPLFRKMEVYSHQQDQDKNLFQQLYEAVVGGVSTLLENIPRREVATKADISGPLENPRASTWEVLVKLIQNAFFKAILPGLEPGPGRANR